MLNLSYQKALGYNTADFSSTNDRKTTEESNAIAASCEPESPQARNGDMLERAGEVEVIFLKGVGKDEQRLETELTKKGFAFYVTDEITKYDYMVAIKQKQFIKCKDRLNYLLALNLGQDSLFNIIKNLFISHERVHFKLDNNSEMSSKWDWDDVIKNTFDHKPIQGKLKIQKQNSKIYEALSSIGSFSKSLLFKFLARRSMKNITFKPFRT